MDRDGNVYVAGLSDSTLTIFDVVIIKYDSSGAVKWTVRYDGPGHLSDSPAAIVVDTSGNVIIAGSTARSWTNVDALLLKLDPEGQIVWAVEYDGPTGQDDTFSDVAIDTDGNVYAAGLTGGSTDPESGDALLVKYNQGGERQWVALFDGEAHRHDHAVAVRVGPDGGVITAGLSRGFGEYWNSDIVMVRYDGRDGSTGWIDRYDNSESSEEPRAMAIDTSGNTYVTGLCTRATGGGGYSVDYVTIKHDRQGHRLWTALYDGPTQGWDQANAIVVDLDENVYVTGMSSTLEPNGGYDILTLRYDSNGVQRWSQRFAETNHTEVALGIGMDAQKNIYVAGWTAVDGANFLTLKYDDGGIFEWKKQYAGAGGSDDQAVAIAVAPSGRFYVTGQTFSEETGEDLLTVGYENDGRQAWKYRFIGPGVSTNIARAMTADPEGNTYITGARQNLATGWDFLTVKCDAAGHRQWAANYDGPLAKSDVPQAIATDRLGNVYVAGFAEGPINFTALVKYDPDGNMLWEQLRPENFPRAIAVDSLGNIFVVGYNVGTTLLDFSTLKYDPAGALLWSATFDGALHNNDGAFGVALDPAGNAYVTGPGFMTSQLADYITVKYSPGGSLLWARSHDGAAAGEDIPYAIAVDDSGNAFVTGTGTSQSGDFDIVTMKYNPEGDEQWRMDFDGGGNRNDQGFAMALDHESNVYLTGVIEGTTGPNDFNFVTMKYGPDGSPRWSRQYDGTGNLEDAAIAIGLDPKSGVYVSGPSQGMEHNFDIATIKYDSSGNYQWAARFSGGMNREDIPVGLSVGSTGNVFVGGTSGGEWSSNVFAFLKYDQIPAAPPPLPPIALFSVREITFETVDLECRSTHYVTIRNAGPVALVIQSIATSDSSFSVIPSSCTIGPGQTADLEITFDPVSPGYHAGQIYLHHNAAGSRDSIAVQGTADGVGTPTLISASVGARWNLVSLPVTSTCPYSAAGCFEYHGSYNLSDSLSIGVGYWKRYPGPSIQAYVGNPILADTVSLVSGWNLIGAIGMPVTTDQIGSDPPGLVTSAFYGYRGSYAEASTLVPGFGYWVRVDEPGALILHAAGSAASDAARIRIVPSEYDPPPPPGDQSPSGPAYRPANFSLHGNYPNPFNPTTIIRYEVAEFVHVTLTVHDILGREIATLVDGPREAGRHEVFFEGSDLPGGIYFYRIRAGRFTGVGKMALVK